jgi:uncharacterized protein YndB with AHSA1/START domain
MTTAIAVATQTFRVWINATPEAIWAALTEPEQLARYGYGSRIDFELRPGGVYRANSTEEMLAFGAPPVMVEGEVLEVEPPHRLAMTWHALFGPETASEPVTTLSYELETGVGGVTKLTLTHELDGAPITAAIVGGAVAEAGGGWGWVLSDLKTLLETGAPLAAQMRP